jgi:hypothetical protein
MKIQTGDIASVTRYSRRQTDGANGCVCLKSGRVIRVRNVDAFLVSQLAEKSLIDDVFEEFGGVMRRFDGVVRKVFG